MNDAIVHLEKIKEYIQHSNFSKDLIVAVLGVILGAFLTAYINKRAVYQKAQFDMQQEYLERFRDTMRSFCTSIEDIEIILAIEKWKTEKLADDIQELDTKMVRFANIIDEERQYVRKYISAKTTELYKIYLCDWHKIFFEWGTEMNSGLPVSELRNEIDKEKIADLRNLERDMQRLNDCFSAGLEKLISPGLISKVRRKVRKVVMLIAHFIGNIRAYHYHTKRKKKREK